MLANLSEGYREAAIRLRVAVQEAKAALDGLTGEELQEGRARLASLREALREARDLREVCEHYYDPGYVPPAGYTCRRGLYPSRVDETIRDKVSL